MSERDLRARLPGPVTGRPRRPLSNRASTASWSIRFSLFTMISGAPRSSRRFRRLLRLITRRYRSFRSEVAKRPPSSCTIGRRSGGMTGTQSRTMPIGELRVVWNAETTLSRFRARVFFCPRPVAMVSRRDSASASRSKLSRRFWIAAAPMPPSKYRPNRSRISRYSTSSPSRSWTLRFLNRSHTAVRRLLVDRGDHVGGEVDDLLQVLRREVEQVAEPAGDALEVPDVRHRGGQLDVAHALTAHLGAGHLDAAALADDALEPDPLVLAAVALPVPGGTEDLLAEEPVLLRLEGAVVDRLRLLHLAVGPLTDLVGGRQADAQLVKEVDVQHVCPSLVFLQV